MFRRLILILSVSLLASSGALAEDDVAGSQDHPALSRYPGSVIEWYRVENHLPYKIAVGPVTGYRKIDDWIETAGRVTRIFYALKGGKRSHTEVWQNYRDAIVKAGFDIVAEGQVPERNVKKTVGGRDWLGVYFTANPWETNGAVGTMGAGSSTVGGSGVVIGRKERAEGTLYVSVAVVQYSAEQVSTLVDVVEENAAETGLVIANAEAIGADIAEYGRVVLDGLLFDHDKATLQPASKPALDEIAKFLNSRPQATFFAVGHTDLTGSIAYNQKLSADRAAAVVAALIADYGIARERLAPHGVGPLSSVFTNASDAGRGKNRRVELVQAQVVK